MFIMSASLCMSHSLQPPLDMCKTIPVCRFPTGNDSKASTCDTLITGPDAQTSTFPPKSLLDLRQGSPCPDFDGPPAPPTHPHLLTAKTLICGLAASSHPSGTRGRRACSQRFPPPPFFFVLRGGGTGRVGERRGEVGSDHHRARETPVFLPAGSHCSQHDAHMLKRSGLDRQQSTGNYAAISQWLEVPCFLCQCVCVCRKRECFFFFIENKEAVF